MLNYWRQKGIAGHKILGFAALDPRHVEQIKQSVYLFGGTYIGVQLPLSAQDQDTWDVPPSGPIGNGEPGSWGGHAVCVVAYNAKGLWVVTWGKLLFMTWAFWQTYCDEAYAVFSTDMLAKAEKPGRLRSLPVTNRSGRNRKRKTHHPDLRFTPHDLRPHGSRITAHGSRFPRSRHRHFHRLWHRSLRPLGDGMRLLAQKIAAQNPGQNVQILAFGYNQTPPAPYSSSPDGLCRWIKDQPIALSAQTTSSPCATALAEASGRLFRPMALDPRIPGPDKLSPPFTFDQIVFFDPVPDLVRFGQGQHARWFVPITISPNVLCFYQREGLLLGIKGEPILRQPGVTNINVTDWTHPQPGDIVDFLWLTGIINDSRVQAMIFIRRRNAAHRVAGNPT